MLFYNLDFSSQVILVLWQFNEINLEIFIYHQTQLRDFSIFFFQEMNIFKEFNQACEQSARCDRLAKDTIQWNNCVFECISPTCYKEIYEFDEVRNIFSPSRFARLKNLNNLRRLKILSKNLEATVFKFFVKFNFPRA